MYETLQNDSFHGFISAPEAQAELVRNSRPGLFLVRFSSQPGQYAISYITDKGVINHTRINYALGRGFQYRDSFYLTLSGLISAIAPELKLTSACPGSKYRILFTEPVGPVLYRTVAA